jgi:hypothetical protein
MPFANSYYLKFLDFNGQLLSTFECKFTEENMSSA